LYNDPASCPLPPKSLHVPICTLFLYIHLYLYLHLCLYLYLHICLYLYLYLYLRS